MHYVYVATYNKVNDQTNQSNPNQMQYDLLIPDTNTLQKYWLQHITRFWLSTLILGQLLWWKKSGTTCNRPHNIP